MMNTRKAASYFEAALFFTDRGERRGQMPGGIGDWELGIGVTGGVWGIRDWEGRM